LSAIGKRLRLTRLLPGDGRIVIIPHETMYPDRDWAAITKAAIKGGADALIVTPGILKRYHDVIGKTPVILTTPLEPEYIDLALKVDAAAVKWHYFGPIDKLPWFEVQRFAAECDDAGMPFLYEPVPMDKLPTEGGSNITDPAIVADACAKAVSRGVDIVKCHYTGTPESFRKVTSGTPAPVVVLGGPLAPDRQALELIKGAMEGGAIGGAIGRNTTTHRSPEKIVRALSKIIHDDATVDKALKELA
jgi:DhnA family fructose-bisphosphate aldolase class Ia